MPAHGTGATTPSQHEIRLLTRFARETAESLEASWAIYQRTPGDPPPWEDQAAALAALDQLLSRAKAIRTAIEADVGPLVPRGDDAPLAVLAGVGKVEAHGSGKKEVWDVEAVQSDVSARLGARLSDDPYITVDEDQCALPVAETVLRAVSRTVEEMVALCGQTPSASWRSIPLRALGLDPKDYKSDEWAGWRVTVTPGLVDEGADP